VQFATQAEYAIISSEHIDVLLLFFVTSTSCFDTVDWVSGRACGYLSGVRCRLFAYGPPDAAAIPMPHYLLPHLNPD